MNAQQLETFEQLAESAMNPTAPTDARKAQEALAMFSSEPQLTAQLKYVLDNSSSSNARTYAAVCLNKLIEWRWNSFKPQTRVDIRNYVLNELAERGPSLDHILRVQLLTLLARITKLGWFDGSPDDAQAADDAPPTASPVHQTTVDQVTTFFRSDSPHHSLIGLAILVRLLEELGTSTAGMTLTQHRKVSISFRDTALLKIFKLSVTTLRALDSNNISDAEKSVADAIMAGGLRLAALCLTYDFVGTSPVESTEDHAVLKIPASWKPLFDDGNGTELLTLFWNMFNKSRGENRARAMEIIVELSSVRRSLFSDEEHRNSHLESLMNGIADLLMTWQSDSSVLGDDQTLHHFCRLLARLKGNFQLTQIVNAEGYSDWIRLVAQFSLQQDWSEHANSHFYVMTLWSRLVAAIPYLDSTRSRAATTGLLEQYAPKVLEAFIDTRLGAVENAVRDDPTDDPLPDEDAVTLAQLDALPALGRLKYMRTATALERQLGTPGNVYSQMRQSGQMSEDLAIAEGQLALLVLVIAGIVGGRSGASSSNTEAHNEIDAMLTARVLKILHAHDQALEQQAAGGRARLPASTKRLELSLVAFLQEFRKVYIGDVSLGTTRTFEKLEELIGIGDSKAMLQLIMRKIALNLRLWASEPEVISLTTKLFYELVTGYASIRLIVKLDSANAVLANHTSEHFPFLDNLGNHRARVRFYTTLAKLLYMKSDGSSDTERDVTPEQLFAAFVSPLTTRLEMLLSRRDNQAALRSEEAHNMLLGLLLDLRGIAQGVYSRNAYERLFNWLYPDYAPALQRAAEVWHDTPAILHPLLKFWLEFVTNRSTRILFDCSSANGILLFKETSAFIVTIGQGVAALGDVPVQEAYQRKYKTVMLALSVLTAALQGNYCFRAADHQILTNRGFLFLDEAEALRADALQVASYDARTQQLVYQTPRRIVVQSGAQVAAEGGFVEFTARAERARWATPHAADAATKPGSGVSVVATSRHRMYVRDDAPRAPFAKCEAGALLRERSGDSVRLLAAARGGVAVDACKATVQPAAGVAGDKRAASLELNHAAKRGASAAAWRAVDAYAADVEPIAVGDCGSALPGCWAPLALGSPQSRAAALELFGFWFASERGAERALSLRARTKVDARFMADRLRLLALECCTAVRDDVAAWTFAVTAAPEWVALFGVDGDGGAPAWLWQVDREALRCVLRGAQRASGEHAADAVIAVRSECVRDDVVRILLHAGYAASFSAAADGVWLVRYADADSDAASAMIEPALTLGDESSAVSSTPSSRAWCFDMDDGFVVVRRAKRRSAARGGGVAAASLPTIQANCNFGVFALYDDPALTNAIATGFELALAVPLDHILQYTKLTSAYYAFVDRITAHHIEYACMLPRDQFKALLQSLDHGLTYSEVAVSTQCCASLDHLATYAHKYRDTPPERAPDAWRALVEHVTALRSDFSSAFRTLLHTSLFGNCQNQWSFSRPLFSLALMLPDALDSYSSALVAKQADVNRERLAQCFSRLMQDCANNLAYKTRDQFTQNFQQFKNEVSKFVTQTVTI